VQSSQQAQSAALGSSSPRATSLRVRPSHRAENSSSISSTRAADFISSLMPSPSSRVIVHD
jgi:hypothetical protein